VRSRENREVRRVRVGRGGINSADSLIFYLSISRREEGKQKQYEMYKSRKKKRNV
jgi:hypothetical protein